MGTSILFASAGCCHTISGLFMNSSSCVFICPSPDHNARKAYCSSMKKGLTSRQVTKLPLFFFFFWGRKLELPLGFPLFSWASSTPADRLVDKNVNISRLNIQCKSHLYTLTNNCRFKYLYPNMHEYFNFQCLITSYN